MMPEQVTYSHSLNLKRQQKVFAFFELEETAKGIRISVHVYANDHEKQLKKVSICI